MTVFTLLLIGQHDHFLTFLSSAGLLGLMLSSAQGPTKLFPNVQRSCCGLIQVAPRLQSMLDGLC